MIVCTSTLLEAPASSRIRSSSALSAVAPLYPSNLDPRSLLVLVAPHTSGDSMQESTQITSRKDGREKGSIIAKGSHLSFGMPVPVKLSCGPIGGFDQLLKHWRA